MMKNMMGPQNCREHLNMYYRLNSCKQLLEILMRDNEEELAQLPDDLKQYHKAHLYRHVKEKVDANDDIVVMY